MYDMSPTGAFSWCEDVMIKCIFAMYDTSPAGAFFMVRRRHDQVYLCNV